MQATRWTAAVLEPMRLATDPPADAVITSLFKAGDVTSVSTLFATLVANESPVPADLPPQVRDYFEQTEGLPAWSDAGLISQGEPTPPRSAPKLAVARTVTVRDGCPLAEFEHKQLDLS